MCLFILSYRKIRSAEWKGWLVKMASNDLSVKRRDYTAFNSDCCIQFSSQTRLVDTGHKRAMLRQKPAIRAGRAHLNARRQGACRKRSTVITQLLSCGWS